MKRVLKWEVPVDDQFHPVGAGPVVHVAAPKGPYVVTIWTLEDPSTYHLIEARVYGTGQDVPDNLEPVGSVVSERTFVWHVFRAGTS